jgi:hypothetical protein
MACAPSVCVSGQQYGVGFGSVTSVPACLGLQQVSDAMADAVVVVECACCAWLLRKWRVLGVGCG